MTFPEELNLMKKKINIKLYLCYDENGVGLLY